MTELTNLNVLYSRSRESINSLPRPKAQVDYCVVLFPIRCVNPTDVCVEHDYKTLLYPRQSR